MRRMGKRSVVWLQRMREWFRALDFTLARRFGLATREDRVFFALIALIGVIAGLLGSAVHALISVVQAALWASPGTLVEAAAGLPNWRVVAAPALGGVVVGLILWITRQPAGGGGMSSLIESVALSGGRIPVKPALAHALAAVATVGSGGSLGREGPMIRLGAMISSWAGQRLGLPAHRLKILVGCGTAAGLAAAYNIPVGSALFAMEVILGNFALEIFGPIVASSVISTLIARNLAGNTHFYEASGYTMASGWEILPYAGLGIVGALASVLFVLGVRSGRRLFGSMWFLPQPLKPVIGMTLVGFIALGVPQVLGGGQDVINLALAGELELPPQWGLHQNFTILLLLGLAFAKLVATSLTTGSGASGGLFTPSLFFGALIGGAYGFWVHSLWPDIASPYGAYAAVGMAAVAAGTSHAPISAILILFEFTGNYDLILPLMVAAIISSLVSRSLRRTSIYTDPLRSKGIELPWRMEEAVLAGLKAEDLARTDPDVLRPGTKYSEVVEKFLATRRQRLFVVREDGELLGAVSLHDIKHALESPEGLTAVVAHDLMLPVGATIRQGERLHRATEVFAKSDFERLPVVDAAGKFLGVLAKRDLLAVYAQEVLGRPALLATFVSSQDAPTSSRHYVEIPPDFALRQVPVPRQLVGRTLAEARLPQLLGSRVIEVRRAGHLEEKVIPAGDTRLETGDFLTLLGPAETLDQLRDGKLDVDALLAAAVRQDAPAALAANRHIMEIPPDFALRQVPVPPRLVGKTLAEARLPQLLSSRVIEIRRGVESVIPAGDTRLETGDLLTLVGPAEILDQLRDGKLDVDALLAALPAL
jgi:CIC family chloride channel protein